MPTIFAKHPGATTGCGGIWGWIAGGTLLLFAFQASAQPGHVYLVIGSDTAIWNTPTTVDVYTRHPHYSQNSFTLSNAPIYQIMDPAWRNQYRDYYQQPIKFTWWMMGGNIYRDSDNLNVPVPNTMALYLMNKYHGAAIRQFGDELSLHYHTFYWSDYNLDGIYHWNQSRTFEECKDDWDVTLAQYLLEEEVFPVSFRSGWHFMDADWQECLNQLIPYCFHDDYGVFRAWNTNEPIAGVEDWTRAPSAFVPFHPSTNDYQVPGEGPGWNVRSIKMQNLVQADLNYMFSQASNGVDQVACLWSHLPENYVAMIAKTTAMVQQASASYPEVPFRYCTAIEAMQRWQGMTNETPPQLSVVETDTDQSVLLTITTDKPLFQPRPFVALRDAGRRYLNISSICVPTGSNTWTVRLPVSRPYLAKVGVTVTDNAGNSTTRVIKYLPDDLYIDNLDPQYAELAGNWSTSTNSAWGTDSRIALLGSNEMAHVRWTLPISVSGQYNIAAQIPSLTNTCTNITFNLIVADSNLCSLHLPAGLHTNQWNFLCSAILNQNVTNTLEMLVTNISRSPSWAAADVISLVPTPTAPLLPQTNTVDLVSTAHGVLLRFNGEPGSKCQVQRSVEPGSGWTTLDVLAIPLTGLLEFEDGNPPVNTAFYRVIELSPTQ